MIYQLTVLALWAVAATHAENVTLTFTRDNQRLDIRCSFKVTGQGQVSHVASLALIRVTPGGEEVMATSSLLPEDHAHLLGATVTSGFSADTTSETFVNLRWVTPTKALDGQYRCELDGFDSHNTHTELSVTHTLKLTDIDPALTLTPEEVKVGLSRTMDLNCSVNDLSTIGMTKVFSIELRAVRQGQGVSLATASLNKKNEIFPGSENAVVKSQLDSKANFLAMSWLHPLTNLTGRYICDVNGLNGYTPVNFVRYVDVEVKQPNPEDLVSHIQDWERKYDVLVDQLHSALQDVDVANTSMELCMGTRTYATHCSNVTLDPGRYPVTLALDNGNLTDVICEVERPGRVWTVFQRRFDGSVSFDRNLTEYEDGFGSTGGEYWLGFNKIRALLGDKPTNLRITMRDHFNRLFTRNYAEFEIGDGPGYALHLGSKGSYAETHGLVEYGSGYNFSTIDAGPKQSCAKSYGGGWWMNACGQNNLNARNQTSYGFVWYDRHGSVSSSYNLHASEMKFLSV